MIDNMRKFDLNIERVLEHWTVAHALREVIANALDEAALTGTASPEIFKDDVGSWHIKDAGRGLRYEHLTQNENKEKLKYPELVIGKFGVGLKDALATFDRRHIQVRILHLTMILPLAQLPSTALPN
jgi:DNA gyrase/topoisomerase IV subunit B